MSATIESAKAALWQPLYNLKDVQLTNYQKFRVYHALLKFGIFKRKSFHKCN